MDGDFPLGEPRPTTLKAHVLGLLRTAILSGRYRPGARLNESQLAREFKISRIPIREALMQLQENGLVTNHERRGMFVTELSPEDVQRINSIRVVLEAEALRLCRANMTKAAAARLTALVEQLEAWEDGAEPGAAAADCEFHRTIWSLAGNPYLARTLDSLCLALFAQGAHDPGETGGRRRGRHRRLLDVVLGRSSVSPEDAVIAHLRVSYDEPEKFSSYAPTQRTAQPAVDGSRAKRRTSTGSTRP
ncbi:GntR family transcriptional regulator [Phenylobacterium sp.]|uniref:GntR family transcriptional regulator n=1 Tax=Phenylobacterium sp. TaxID=1871053 RepID=UPI0028981A70|nr:GntR family transcriptional regulator [Phenylobacterium sp.]